MCPQDSHAHEALSVWSPPSCVGGPPLVAPADPVKLSRPRKLVFMHVCLRLTPSLAHGRLLWYLITTTRIFDSRKILESSLHV